MVDHGFEEMGGHDDAFAILGAESHDRALHIGQIFQIDLHAEIAARNHDAVRLFDDRFEVFDTFLILDLGDDFHPPDLVAHERFQLLDVSGLAHE